MTVTKKKEAVRDEFYACLRFRDEGLGGIRLQSRDLAPAPAHHPTPRARVSGGQVEQKPPLRSAVMCNNFITKMQLNSTFSRVVRQLTIQRRPLTQTFHPLTQTSCPISLALSPHPQARGKRGRGGGGGVERGRELFWGRSIVVHD